MCCRQRRAGFTDRLEGAGSERGDRVDFDRRVRLEFRGTQLSWDGGLPAMREPDDALGLSDIASGALCDARRGKNTIHRLVFRQSVYGRPGNPNERREIDEPGSSPDGNSDWLLSHASYRSETPSALLRQHLIQFSTGLTTYTLIVFTKVRRLNKAIWYTIIREFFI